MCVEKSVFVCVESVFVCVSRKGGCLCVRVSRKSVKKSVLVCVYRNERVCV